MRPDGEVMAGTVVHDECRTERRGEGWRVRVLHEKVMLGGAVHALRKGETPQRGEEAKLAAAEAFDRLCMLAVEDATR